MTAPSPLWHNAHIVVARTKTPTFNYAGWVAERARAFTGRAWLFRAIDGWLADPAGRRFFLLTGEPGSGKSAVAARLLQFSLGDASPPPDVTAIRRDFLSAAHVCSARDRRWINPLAFSESLALQLAARYPAFAEALVEKQADQAIQMDVRQTVDHVEGGRVTGIEIKNLHLGRLSPEDAFLRVVREPLEALFQSEFGSGSAARVLILVDALDESLPYTGGAGIVDLLAQADFLPSGVRFLLTTRPDERVLNHFLDAAEVNISAEARARQNRADLTAFIRRSLAEKPALAQAAADLQPAQQETLVDDVAARADGNFLYVRFLFDEAAAGRRSLADLDALPRGLDGLYFHSLDRVVKLGEGTWRDDYAPLIGILSAAQASLTESQLETFSGRSDLWSLLGDLGQFIDAVPPESDEGDFRYRLYHQSVADFLGRRHVRLDGRRLRNSYYLPPDPWHQAIADHYWEHYGDDWSRCDPYGLDNLAAHLYHGQQFDRLVALIDQEWMAARFERDDYTYDGFLADLDLAWEHAHREAHRQAQAGDEPTALVDCVRYALIQTSINALSANYVPELVAQALKTDLWSGQRALSVAGRIRQPKDRVKMLAALLESGKSDPGLHTEAQERGLAAALALEDEGDRTGALAALAPHLEGEGLERGLAAALNIGHEWFQAMALAALAPHLEGAARTRAQKRGLAAALAIKHEGYRASALAALAPYLEGEGLERGLAAARALNNWFVRAETLAALAPHLEGAARTHTLEWGLAAALAIGPSWHRSTALAALAPHLEGKARTRALEDTLARGDGLFLARDLAALAPHLEGEGLERVLAAARAIGDEGPRAEALTALAPHLEGKARRRALKWGLAAALAIKHERYRASALAALAPHLEGKARRRALKRGLTAARAIGDERVRAEALAALAPHLEGKGRTRALKRGLAAALAIEDEGKRARALAALAPHLEGKRLERGLAAALALEDEGDQTEALAALAPHLEGEGRTRALKRGLAAALAIKREAERARVLAALAPHLEGEGLERGLAAALAIKDEEDRAEALAALAPKLEGEGLERGLAAALAIKDEEDRAEALAALAPKLEGEGLERGLAAAKAIKDKEYRAGALAALAPHLEGKARRRGLERGLAAARDLGDEGLRAEALTALAPHLEGKARRRALKWGLAAARAIGHEWFRAEALAALAPHLEGKARRKALKWGLAAARALGDEWFRADALAALAPHLKGKGLERGLAAALAIKHEWPRAEVLSALAPHLEGEELERGLAGARAIKNDGARAYGLLGFLPLLPGREPLLTEIRAAVADHLRHNLAQSERDAVLDFIAELDDDRHLFTPPIFSQPTLAAIADQVVEVTTEWRWL